MKKYVNRKSFCMSLSVILLISFTPLCSFAIQPGDPFPEFSTLNTLTPEDISYLEITKHPVFFIKEIKKNIVVIEFLNVYCHTCRMQVEIFNDLFHTLQNDPILKKNVCLLGIAVGNTAEEIKDFKKNFGAEYPILADPKKAIFKLTGNILGTPHTYILSGKPERFVIDYHAGGVSSIKRYLQVIKTLLSGEITGNKPGNLAPPYSFSYQGNQYNQKYFRGKKLLLYFPAKIQYPLPMDTRRPELQLEILSQIINKFPDIYLIFFKTPAFLDKTLEQIDSSRVFMLESTGLEWVRSFSVSKEPLIYYINQFGRISFRGPSITLFNAQEIVEGKQYKIAPELDEKQIIRLIESNIERMGKKVLQTEKTKMENGKEIYISTLSQKDTTLYLFSRVESRLSVCDICHNSHFVYIIDQQGLIRDFIPIALTKYGNTPWTEEDVEKMRSVLLGKSIFDDFYFRPKVDAVTTATMTSSLIFEALQEAKEMFRDFKEYQFRKSYWTQLCFQNICTIKKAVKEMNARGLSPIGENAQLNNRLVEKFVPGSEFPRCPLGGIYLLFDGDIICSVHGMNISDCQN